MSRVSSRIDDPKALISDFDVVLSPLSVKRRQSRDAKRDRHFLKGPISFAWIRDNIPDPTSRVVLIARALMDMTRSDHCALTAKVWDCSGVADRYQRKRILARLREVRGDFEIEDRVGRPSVLRRAKPPA